MTVLRARADLYGKRFSTVQITVQYRCIFVLIFGRYSLQVDNNIDYLTCHLYFLGIHSRLKARVSTEKIQVTRGIFHVIPR